MIDKTYIDLLDFLTKAVQMTFFLVVGFVTVLTYRRARLTFFQPMKAEIFKAQLEEIRELLRLFVGKREVDLRKDMCLRKILDVNAVLMFDEYAATFFDVKLDLDERPYNTRDCPTVIADPAKVELADGYEKSSRRDREEVRDPSVRAALWADYNHPILALPRGHTEAVQRLTDVLESPILPKPCAKLVEDYLETVHANVLVVGEVLTEAAKEMPRKYPSRERLENSILGWVHNMHLERVNDLKPEADKIVGYARSYFESDDVLSL